MSAFRSQLLLEEQRRLYDVWLDAASGGQMPTRQMFQPKSFAALLPWVSLVDRSAAGELRVRVAGSQLRDVLGCEPGEGLLGGTHAGACNSFMDAFASRRPVCGTHMIHGGREGPVLLVWLRLPLGSPDSVEAVLGLDISLARTRVPDWALARIAV